MPELTAMQIHAILTTHPCSQKVTVIRKRRGWLHDVYRYQDNVVVMVGNTKKQAYEVLTAGGVHIATVRGDAITLNDQAPSWALEHIQTLL